LKWASIELTIPFLCRELKREKLNEFIFEQQVYATIKYDGTNVGRDESGLMYGRNLTIEADAVSYLKTPLTEVKKVDASTVKGEILAMSGIETEKIEKMVVYGELMCNRGLFTYDEEKLYGSWPVFGAMIKPVTEEATTEIAEKLGKAGFACQARSDRETVMLMMNAQLKELLTTKLGIPTVPTAEKMGTLYDLVKGNYEFMEKGSCEGMVVVSPASGSNCAITKWKIGAEANTTNVNHLETILNEMEAEGETWFGDNVAKAKDMFTSMMAVAQSKNKVEPVKKGGNNKGAGSSTDKKNGDMSDEAKARYGEPIKSARTKFDHCEVYFAKDKNPMNYIKLIVEETLSSGDITVDKSSKAAMKEHEKVIRDFIMPEFAEWKKKSAGAGG